MVHFAGGYDIPKGYMVQPNIWAIHHDPKLWKDPETFNPDRFIEDGKFVTRPGFVAFSTGRRVCMGEALAKSELHMATATLFQKFRFEAPPGEVLTLKPMNVILTLFAESYKIVTIPRDT